MGFDFRKSILVSKLSCLPKNLLWILTAFWKKSFWRWVLFLVWKLIKNNRKSAKIILIFFGVIETGSQKCIQISKGILIRQTVWFLDVFLSVCAPQKGKDCSLLFSKRKILFIAFLKSEMVFHCFSQKGKNHWVSVWSLDNCTNVPVLF